MKRTRCILLSLILALAGIVGLCVPAAAASFQVGDVVKLGSYPQTRIKDGSLISALNAAAADWHSYGYYSGTEDTANGAMTAKDYMQYCDMTLDGAKYRGVKFTQYRPNRTGYSTSADNSNQDENGYSANTTYWFRYEKLRWSVLDPSTGLLLCDSIIDSQPVSNYVLASGGKYYGDAGKTHYANNYAESSLRAWLNDDFLNAAFTKEEQDAIVPATIDNSAYSTFYSNYDSASTTDNVFLLSYREAANPAYSFSYDINTKDAARQAQGTDYAKCQGLTVAPNGNSPWWLRSAGYASASVCSVHAEGYLLYNYAAYYTNYGVRPAITIDLDAVDASYETGEIVEFGSYPQTRVTDNSLIAALNNAPQTWKYYGYFDAKNKDNIMPPSDFIQYCDVTLGGAKYRGVKFTAFRSSTGGAGTAADSYVDNNGYALNTVYWFLYEPLQWRVLDPQTGLVLCEMLIDAQPYHYYALREKIDGNFISWGDPDRTYYANNYEKSSIRAWLNDDFRNAAFTPVQQSKIMLTTLDNSAWENAQYDSAATTDAVFLLSRNDMLNTAYGFDADFFATQYDPAPARKAKGTDYAKCQGLRLWTEDGYTYWLLRTAGGSSIGITNVDYHGAVLVSGRSYDAEYGVRPAITLDLDCIPFENYKTQKTAVVDAMARSAGSDACLGAFRKAKDDIDAIAYDESKTMKENKAVVDAVVTALSSASLNHNYSDVGTITFADDYSYATEAFVCENCGGTYTLTDSELDFVVTKTATCVDDTAGKYKAEFNRPAVLGGGTDSKLSDEVTLSGTATGNHTFEWVTDTQPTCGQDGTKHEECAVCHAKRNENTPIPATGNHTYEWVTDAQPTCGQDGTKHEECSVCHTKQNENTPIPAAGLHDYSVVNEKVEPTCTEGGYTTYKCSGCGAVDPTHRDVVGALGHDFGEWEIVRPATPTENGEKKRTCARCGATETAEIGADSEPILYSFADGQTGSALSMTVPYARRGAVITQLTAKEPVTYTSSNPKLVDVDDDGNVTLKRLSLFQKSAIITATAENGKTATCRVTIKLKWWQYIIWFLFGSLWY